MVILPFTPCPATGDAFLGRQGLVRNLRGRIARGESLAVIGGPKLGKTSLVRTALHGLDHTVIEIDCGAESSPRIDVVPGSIVVLENLDSFADSAIESLLARVSAAKPTGIIVTGGRRLRAILGHSGTLAVSFRVFPLSVLLDGQTREYHPGPIRNRHTRRERGRGHARLYGCYQPLDSERGGNALRRVSAAQRLHHG